MIKEIQQQIDRIERQIAAEQVVYKSMKLYTDSEMKTVVINQQIGVVRGLEVAKESLNYLLAKCDNRQLKMEMPAEMWMDNIAKRNTISGNGRGDLIND